MVLAAVLCHADILPMPLKYLPGPESLPEVCPLGPWVLIFGSFGTVLGLLLSPYCPRCKPNDMCFIDAACVHQTDPNLMKRGIHGIGGFLLVSKELRIIWSPIYLTRLWCVPRLVICLTQLCNVQQYPSKSCTFCKLVTLRILI